MDRKSGLSRRDFVKAAGAVALGAPAIGALGANEKIGLGFIGVGGRGRFHLNQFSQMDGVDVIAIADVSQQKREQAAASLKGKKVQLFEDFRKLLELKEVDAVVIATPDHWHAICAILACQAGKDVYVEKPCGHNIAEGRAMVTAARKYNRVVQHGTQQRSGPHWIEAVDMIKTGELGKISLVRTWNCWDLKSIHADFGNPADTDPPPGLNYDAWLGPAPKRRYNPRHYDFYFYYFWPYSGGMLSAWGVHLFDVVVWAMGPEIKSTTTIGGKFVLTDARETPDTAAIVWECPDYVLTYEVRHANGKDPFGGMDHGIEFYGMKGTIWINRNGFTFYPEADRNKPRFVQNQGMDRQHKQNFLDCVRSRKKPNADIEQGHLGAIPGHLGNISYRVGCKQIQWDGEREIIPDNTEANALVGRDYRNPYVLPEI